MVTLLSKAGVQTPGLTVAPLGERRILVTAVHLGAPRKGELRGECFKTQREEVTRRTGLVAPCPPSCTFLKDTALIADPLKKTLMEAFKISTTKPHPDNNALIFLYIVVQTTLIQNQG